MDIFGWIIIFLLGALLLVSAVVSACWFFRPNELFWIKHEYITGVIAFGAFFSWWIIIGSTVYYLLWFIPENWMHFVGVAFGIDEPVLLSISFGVGFIVVYIFILIYLSKVRNLEFCGQNEEVLVARNVRQEVSEWRGRLEYMDNGSRIKEAAKLRLKSQRLAKAESQRELTYDQEYKKKLLLAQLKVLKNWRWWSYKKNRERVCNFFAKFGIAVWIILNIVALIAIILLTL